MLLTRDAKVTRSTIITRTDHLKQPEVKCLAQY